MAMKFGFRSRNYVENGTLLIIVMIWHRKIKKSLIFKNDPPVYLDPPIIYSCGDVGPPAYLAPPVYLALKSTLISELKNPGRHF